jgi:autotransporter-associated beta strand protein
MWRASWRRWLIVGVACLPTLPAAVSLGARSYYEGFEPFYEPWLSQAMYPTTAEDPEYAAWPQPPQVVGDRAQGWGVASNAFQFTGGVPEVENLNEGWVRAIGGKFASNGNQAYVATFALDGDLVANYGTRFTMSFFVKYIEGQNAGWRNQVKSVSGRWNYDAFAFGELPAEWTEVTIPFDADWSDDDANANGWFRETGTGSFGDVIRSINPKEHSFGFSTLAGGANAPGTRGLDELRIIPFVPPPDIIIDVPSGTQTQADAGYPQISANENITKIGAGTLVFDASNGTSGTTTVAAGTLRLANPDALFTSPTTVAAGATLAVDPGVTARIPAVTLAGGTLDAPTLAVNTTTGIGTLSVDSGSLAAGAAAVVDGGGTMRLASAARVTLEVASLAVDEFSGGGLIDLGAGQVSIAPGGISPSELRADIIAGRNGGGWNGSNGITSSASALAAGTRAVGYVVSPDGSARVSFAAPGDVNLSGSVDAFDLVAINGSGAYNSGTPSTWGQGDFNYDGLTTVFDLVSISSGGAYGAGNYFPAPPAAVSGVTAVPEPRGVVGLALALGIAAGGVARIRVQSLWRSKAES